MKKLDEKRRERLFQAVESSYRELEPFRRMTRALVAECAGDGYGGGAGGRSGEVPRETVVNLLNQTVDAYMMNLAANRPRVLVSTHHQGLLPFAAHFQVAVNNLIKEIRLEKTIQRWVLDAFFCAGIVKCHMSNSGLVEIEQDVLMDPGKPFASNVSLDNWVHDTSATNWTEVTFAGDVYRIPHEDLQDDTIYDQGVASKLEATSKRDRDTERIENVSRGYETDPDEYLPHVDLIDLYLPREGMIETYACTLQSNILQPYGEPLAVMEWDGSETGPYKLLGFHDVPENIMPSSPASHLRALSQHVNSTYRKLIQSAADLKEVTGYRPSGEKDARNLRSGKHGDLISMLDPSGVVNFRSGGIPQDLSQFLLQMQADYNDSAGNLQAMLGLGAQADTAAQEKLIHGAVSGKTASMGYRVMAATEELVRDLGKMLWNDQFNIIPGQLPIDGLDGFAVQSDWTPLDREGSIVDYDMEIDVQSMRYKSGGERLQMLLRILGDVYFPGMESLAAAGGVIDWQSLTEIVADLSDTPRLKQVIRFTGGVPDETKPGPQGKGGTGQREYIHRSVPTGGTQQGRNIMRQQAWAGTESPQQAEALARQ